MEHDSNVIQFQSPGFAITHAVNQSTPIPSRTEIEPADLMFIAHLLIRSVYRSFDWEDAFGAMVGVMLDEADSDAVLRLLRSATIDVTFAHPPHEQAS